jgi:hypothetical protein
MPIPLQTTMITTRPLSKVAQPMEQRLPNSILCPCWNQVHHYEVHNRNPVLPKACGMVYSLDKPNLPSLPSLDSALHILSGCKHTQISNMINERHNLACSMLFKAISKTGSLGSCVVCMDILGSSKRLAMQNLQIPDTAETRILSKWLFLPCFSEPQTVRML